MLGMYFSLLYIVLSRVMETTERVVLTSCSQVQDMLNVYKVFGPRIFHQVQSAIMNIVMG